MTNYLYIFILHGSFIFGHVDKIEDSVALVEIKTNKGIKYKHVSINDKVCSPKEGQGVLLNDYEIIKCL